MDAPEERVFSDEEFARCQRRNARYRVAQGVAQEFGVQFGSIFYCYGEVACADPCITPCIRVRVHESWLPELENRINAVGWRVFEVKKWKCFRLVTLISRFRS